MRQGHKAIIILQKTTKAIYNRYKKVTQFLR